MSLALPLSVEPSVEVQFADAIGDGLRVCDLYIGSTGTGKSTLCRSRAIERHKEYFKPEKTAKSGTKDPMFGESEDRTLMCDTRGFGDIEVSDAQIMTDILSGIFKYDATLLRVVWCVSDVCKMNRDLRTQADFIASLIPEGSDRVAFWRDSVALVMKGLDSNGLLNKEDSEDDESGDVSADGGLFMDEEWKTDEDDEGKERILTGPEELAIERGGKDGISVRRNIQILNFISKKEKKVFKKWKDEERLKTGRVWWGELAGFQREFILSKLTPFKVIKLDDRCVKCGLSGDHRLWPEGCHKEFEYAHPGEYHGWDSAKEKCQEFEQNGSKMLRESMIEGAMYVTGRADRKAVTQGKHLDARSLALCAAAGAVLGAASVGTAYGVASGTEYITRKWQCCSQSSSTARGCRLRCPVCLAWKNQRNDECTGKHQLCECHSDSSDECICKVIIRE